MNNAEKLIEKYKAGQCSPEEILMLQNWFHHLNKDEDLKLSEETLEQVSSEMWGVIDAKTSSISKTRVHRLKYWSAAAAIFVALFGGGLFYLIRSEREAAKLQIKPGEQMATLTLSNGKKIELTSTLNNEVITEHGVSITKTADGQLVYTVKGSTTDTSVYNTVSTACGQQYQIVLPDGSLIYLNAGSSITYSTGLQQTAVRRIKLAGEAYFEVTKDKKHPFEVISGNQKVEVLGTHFNIKSYADEPNAKTTLVEGSVKVSWLGHLNTEKSNPFKILVPGEQAVLSRGTIAVETVNPEEAIYWKENKFGFQSEEIESVMRDVARWYNVNVIYQDNVKQVKVSGSVSRFEDITKLLDKLEQTGLLKFTIEGKNVIVSKD